MPKEYNKKKLKSASEILGDGQFYPDLPKVGFSELINKPLVLIDAKIIKDFNGQFGKHDAGLMLFEDSEVPEGESASQFTTINSGQVVTERLEKLIRFRAFPCLVTPVYVNDTYYNLI